MAKRPIGEFLATLRKANGFTQQQVADELGISNKTLSAWEQGHAYPDILSLPALAELYGVTADEILQGERSATAATENKPEISERSKRKLYAQKLSAAQSKNALTAGLTALSGVLLLAAALCTFGAPVWLTLLLCVAALALFCVAVFLFFVFDRAVAASAGISPYIPGEDEGQTRFLLFARHKATRVLQIADFASFLLGVTAIVVGARGISLQDAPRPYYRIVFFAVYTAAAFALLCFTCLRIGRNVRSLGNATEKERARRNGRRLRRCILFAALPFLAGGIVAIVFAKGGVGVVVGLSVMAASLAVAIAVYFAKREPLFRLL